MPFDCPVSNENRNAYEVSMRFRTMVEERIIKLEADALIDEALIPFLDNKDHIRRHTRLVEAQRAEAARMRHFLENARTRLPNPLIAM
jgi:hypothetical protein